MKLDNDLETLPNGAPPRGGRRRGLRRFGKFAGLFVLILVLLVAGTGAWVWQYVNHKFNATHDTSIHTDPVKGSNGENLPPAVAITQPINILVLGSDARDVVEGSNLRQFKTQGTEGQRADTMMLIHLTDGGRKAIALSFPRDLRVQIPGHGVSKINSSYNGGPNLVMDTIRTLTGLQINHYVEVNFSSFQKVVNAVGGVRLCVNRSYADPESGLYVAKPGCYNFDGNKALSFVRMRKSDPEGDFGRIKRQQEFMRVLMSKVKGIGFLADIPRVLRLANAVSTGIKTDPDLSLGLVRTIAEKLAGYAEANVDFRMVPSRPTMIHGVSYVVADEFQAKSLYEALRNDAPLPPYGKTSVSIPVPSDVTIDVKNASGVNGAGKAWADRLRKLGYRVRLVTNAEKPRSQSQIACQPDLDLKANLLSETLTGAQIVYSVNLGHVVDCVVLVGKDHAADALPSASPSSSTTQ